MPNLSYQRGASRERKIKAELEKEGYVLVVRTAGSHSPVDVVAIKEMAVIEGELCFIGKLIQSKTSTKFTKVKKKDCCLETPNGAIIFERWEYPVASGRIKHAKPKRGLGKLKHLRRKDRALPNRQSTVANKG